MQGTGKTNDPFREIRQTEELDELYQRSSERPVILFKHSLTCPISHGAYEEMSHLTDEIALVIVQDARPLSNEIERRARIRHESPQTLIVRDGEIVWHASHGSITKTAVTRALHEFE